MSWHDSYDHVLMSGLRSKRAVSSMKDGQKVATRGALEGDAAKEEVSHGALRECPGTHGMRELFCMTKSTGLKVLLESTILWGQLIFN